LSFVRCQMPKSHSAVRDNSPNNRIWGIRVPHPSLTPPSLPPSLPPSFPPSFPSSQVIVFLSTTSPHTDSALEACFLALAPEGELVVKLCSSEEGGKEEGGREGGAMKMQLLLAGFVNVEALPASASSSASLIAHKPKWEVGAAASVSLPTSSSLPPSSSSSSSTRPTATTTWKLTDVEGVEDEDGREGGLIDPDSLLENDDGLLAAAVARKAEKEKENGGAGCETKKRACKNCSCGRAEMEEGGQGGKEGGVVLPVMTEEELKESVSSCGNCYKGDAFRCGGCPFLGKPAFEAGQEKLIIKLD